MPTVASFKYDYYDHAKGERLPVPAGTVVVVSNYDLLFNINVTITTTGVFPATTVPASSTKGARIAITNLNGSAEYQVRPIV